MAVTVPMWIGATAQCTEMHFASFLSVGIITAIVQQTAKNEERYPIKKQSFSKEKDCYFASLFSAVCRTLRL